MENNVDNMEKKLPFGVPENYFEGFEEKMMARIEAMETAETKEVKMEKVRDLNTAGNNKPMWRKWTAGVAAAVVVLAGLFAVVHLKNDVNQTGEEIIMAASDEEYYDAVNEELNSSEIEEALAQIEFEGEY